MKAVSEEVEKKIVRLYTDIDCPLTQKMISARLGVGISVVVRVLKAAGVKPNKTRRWAGDGGGGAW